MRIFLLAALVVGATLTGLPAKAQSVDADIRIGTSRHHDGDRYSDDNWRRPGNRGYHRGWRNDRPSGYSVRRVVRPAYGMGCRTVVKTVWRDGERVTSRRRICG